MGKQRAVWAVAIVAGALGLAACGSSSPGSSSTSTTTSTTDIAPAAALATGTYAPAGASGTPHYVVTISSAENTDFGGAMNFVYQDGKTSLVFDFSGTVTGPRGWRHRPMWRRRGRGRRRSLRCPTASGSTSVPTP